MTTTHATRGTAPGLRFRAYESGNELVSDVHRINRLRVRRSLEDVK